MTELIFVVEDDPSGGYTARAMGPSIFTEGDTWDQLTAHVREAVEAYYDRPEDMPKLIRLHYVRDEVLTL